MNGMYISVMKYTEILSCVCAALKPSSGKLLWQSTGSVGGLSSYGYEHLKPSAADAGVLPRYRLKQVFHCVFHSIPGFRCQLQALAGCGVLGGSGGSADVWRGGLTCTGYFNLSVSCCCSEMESKWLRVIVRTLGIDVTLWHVTPYHMCERYRT